MAESRASAATAKPTGGNKGRAGKVGEDREEGGAWVTHCGTESLQN